MSRPTERSDSSPSGGHFPFDVLALRGGPGGSAVAVVPTGDGPDATEAAVS